MFNKLRNQLRGDKNASGAERQLLQDKKEDSKSGFICPMCMINLTSAEELQAHFEEIHATSDQSRNESTSSILALKNQDHTPSFQNEPYFSTQSDGDEKEVGNECQANHYSNLVSIENVDNGGLMLEEVNDLKASLKEEKLFSAEMKKQFESMKYENDKLSEELFLMEKQHKIALETNEELAIQKETLEKKASQMTQSIATIKSLNDEYKSQKEVLEEQCQNQSIELEKAAIWVRDLESQLLQRPGADDVMVLKKELISVQTLMDQMALESEEKGKKVEQEREHLQSLLTEANSKVTSIQKELNDHKKEAQVFQTFMDKEKSHSNFLEIEKNRLQEEKLSIANDFEKMSSECSKLSDKCSKEHKKCELLSNQLSQALEEKFEIEKTCSNINQQIRNLQDKHTIQIQEKDAEIRSLFNEKDIAKKQLNDSGNCIEKLKEDNKALHQQIEILQLSIKKNNSENSLLQHQYATKIAHLQIKIDDLEKDKQQIQNEKISSENTLESLEKVHQKDKSLLQSQLFEFERELNTSRLKVSHLEEEKNKKTKELEELQKIIKVLKISNEEFLEKHQKLNTDLAFKFQEIESLKENLQKSAVKIKEEIERKENAMLEASKLREERSLLMAEMETGEGEAAARTQLSEENIWLQKRQEEIELKLQEETREHEAEIGKLTLKLNEMNLLVMSTKEQLKTAEDVAVKLRSEMNINKEKLIEVELELKAKCESLSSQKATAIAQQTDAESRLNALKIFLDDKIKDNEKIKLDLNNARSMSEELKTQIAQIHQDHQLELSNLQSKMKLIEVEKVNALNDVTKWKEEFKSLKNDYAKECDKINLKSKVIENEHNIRIQNLEKELSESRSELIKKLDDINTENSLRTKYEIELKQIKEELTKTLQNNEKIQLDLFDALSLLKEVTSQKSQIIDEKNQLLEKVRKHDNDLTQLNKSVFIITNEKNGLHEEVNFLKEKVELKVCELEKEQQLRIKLEKDHDNAALIATEKELELEKMSNILEKLKSEKLEIEERLNSSLLDKELAIERLHKDMENFEITVKAKESMLEVYETKMGKLEDDRHKQQSDFDDQTANLNKAKKEIQNLRMEIENFELKTQELEKRILTVQSEKQDLLNKLRKQEETSSNLQNKLTQSEINCKDLQENVCMLNDKLENNHKEYQESTSQWRNKLNDHLLENERLQNSVESLNSQLIKEKEYYNKMKCDHDEEILSINTDMKRKEDSWLQERKSYQDQIHSSDVKQNLLEECKTELQMLVEKLQLEIDLKKKTANDARIKMQALLNAKEDIILEMQSNLESKNREIESAEAERVVAESRLQLEIGTLSENLNSTRAEWVACNHRIDQLNKEIEDLHGQLVVAKSTIQSSSDERRALLERCLHAEQDAEARSKKVEELKKKLDDARSAMHELGRENQALQVKHKTTISRQWADDRAATQCRACAKVFSMTVRRHHCRHCGEIFCNECSSRTTTVAASKNPVRVCERCYDELLTAG